MYKLYKFSKQQLYNLIPLLMPQPDKQVGNSPPGLIFNTNFAKTYRMPFVQIESLRDKEEQIRKEEWMNIRQIWTTLRK